MRSRWEDSTARLTRILFTLALPTIVEEILATLLRYVDTAMVGQLGERATAAVSLTTNITWLVNSVPGAIGTAILILIAKTEGEGDRIQIRRLSQQAFFLAVLSGLVLGIISVIASPFIPGWMGAEKAVQREASGYFTIISIPMVFRSVSTVLAAALRAVRNTRIPMLISLISNGMNILLNYILIYRAGLGVAGACGPFACSNGRNHFLCPRLRAEIRRLYVDQLRQGRE